MEDIRARADARLEEALAAAGMADPRPACRDRLKALKAASSTAFARAVDHFEHTLVPAVAGGAEPLAQWLEYARVLAEASGPGRTVIVDSGGRARPYHGPTPPKAAAPADASEADLFEPGSDAGSESSLGGAVPAAGAPEAPPGASLAGGLVLFLSQDTRRGVLPLLVPQAPSPAQTASLDLLVRGRREP